MEVSDFIDQLYAKGGALSYKDGNIKYEGPKGLLTSTELELLKKYKKTIVEMFKAGRFESGWKRESGSVKASHRKGEYSVSDLQKGMLNSCFGDQQSANYNIGMPFRLIGELSIVCLKRSFHYVVNRHDALRTSFRHEHGSFVQKVSEKVEPSMEFIDFSDHNTSIKAKKIEETLIEDCNRTFDLARAPLFRLLIIKSQKEEHIVSMTIHHVISDMWSLQIISHELLTAYAYFYDQKQPMLSAVEAQYSDYVKWLSQYQTDNKVDELKRYWQAYLKGAPHFELPTDYAREKNGRLHFKTTPISLDGSVRASMSKMSSKYGVSEYMVLLTIFNIVLSKFSGKEELVIVTTSNGRENEQFSGTVGVFLRSILIRTKVTKEMLFSDLLRETRKGVLGALEHQYISAKDLAEVMRSNVGSRSWAPIRINFTNFYSRNKDFEDTRVIASSDNELKIHPVEVELRKSTPFELRLECFIDPLQIAAHLEYAEELFQESTIETISHEFSNNLRKVLRTPSIKISELICPL